MIQIYLINLFIFFFNNGNIFNQLITPNPAEKLISTSISRKIIFFFACLHALFKFQEFNTYTGQTNNQKNKKLVIFSEIKLVVTSTMKNINTDSFV